MRRLAKCSRDGGPSRRLLALAEIYHGKRCSDAARLAGVGLQIIRDWVLRFDAAGPDGLIDGKAPGPQRKLTDEQRAALAVIVEAGADPGGPRFGPVAPLRSHPMDLGRVRRLAGRDDSWTRNAADGLC